MDVIIECPLGGKCEHIKDNKRHRCAWYTKLIGKDPQSLKEIDEWACAMAWIPIMMVENTQRVRGMTAATESFRNNMHGATGAMLQLVADEVVSKKGRKGLADADNPR